MNRSPQIVPDGTRTAPIEMVFRTLHKQIGRVTKSFTIPADVCRAINLGYRDPSTIRPDDYANREDEGVLLVPRAGEILHQLKNPPAWA